MRMNTILRVIDQERDLANAVKNYHIGLRDNIKAKAERWHNEALGVKIHYERRNRRNDG